MPRLTGHLCEITIDLPPLLNPEGHPNRITGSKVLAVLLNWWILPVGGVASGRVCAQPAQQACFTITAMPND